MISKIKLIREFPPIKNNRLRNNRMRNNRMEIKHKSTKILNMPKMFKNYASIVTNQNARYFVSVFVQDHSIKLAIKLS